MRETLINKTIRILSKLPNDKIREVSDFSEYILKKYEKETLQKGIEKLVSDSNAFQFLNDEEDLYTVNDINRGKTTGVYIPIQEWEDLKTKFKGLEEVELAEQSKEEILQGLQQAVEEMNLVKQGKLKARDAKDLLNEL